MKTKDNENLIDIDDTAQPVPTAESSGQAEYSPRDCAYIQAALDLLAVCPTEEVPVAAIVVCNDEIVGIGVNRREADKDPTAHAEVLAIRAAAKKLGRWNLSDCELFVTLEPCVMCAGAAVYSRISRVVFGAYDIRFGACGTALNIAANDKLNHRAEIVGGIMAEKCVAPIREFFRQKRKSPREKRNKNGVNLDE